MLHLQDGRSEKRNPHIIDDRQKPITKKNKNRKKREQQRQSLSENQDSESNNANESQDLNDDDVVESWEDIQVVINLHFSQGFRLALEMFAN